MFAFMYVQKTCFKMFCIIVLDMSCKIALTAKKSLNK